MPDILATAVALVAMERLAAWKAEQNVGPGRGAAIALGLAGFARSHLALLLPLAAFFLLDSINPREILAQIAGNLALDPGLRGLCLLLAYIFAVREHNLALEAPTRRRRAGIYPLNLSYLPGLLRFSPAPGRLLAGESLEIRRGRFRIDSRYTGSRRPPHALEIL